MIEALIKLVDAVRWISVPAWKKIIGQLDKETLIWLRDEGVYSFKYFTRDDWMDASDKKQLLQLINERIADSGPEDILTILKGLM